MISAKEAVEAATFTRLSENVTAATVYQDVPDNAPAPLAVLGEMTASPIGGKEDPDRLVAMIIIGIVDAEERQPLLKLQNEIETLLDGYKAVVDGWSLSFTFESDTDSLAEDGQSYISTSSFSVFALRD